MKKKLLNSMRVLLVAVLLGVGVNAWAAAVELLNTSSWVHTHDGGNGDRSSNLDFNSANSSITDNWTASFNVTTSSTNSRTNGSRNYQIALLSASADSYPSNAVASANVLFGAHFATTNNTDYSSFPCTITVNDVDEAETVTLNHNTKYTFNVSVNGTSMTVSIKNGSTSVFSKSITLGAFVKPKGIYDLLPRPYNKTWGVYTNTYDNIIVSKEVEDGFVEVPTGAITAVNGVTRTVSFSCATDGVDFSYSTNNGESFTDGNSVIISETTSIVIKATKGANSATSESIEFEAGTAITLNTPTWKKTAYNSSTGVSTVTLSSDQSSKLLSPTATIYYSIDGGSTNVYTDAISVTDGELLTYYASASGYTNSSEGSVTAVAPNSNPKLWTETYYSSDNSAGITLDTDAGVVTTVNTSDYYYMLASGSRISNRLVTSSAKENNDYWLYRNGGIYSGKAKSYAILGAKKGDYVVITYSKGDGEPTPTATDGAKDEWNSTSTSVAINVTGSTGVLRFSIARYGYINSITVYRALATPGATVNSTYGYATFAADVALDLSTLTDGFTAFVATNVATGSVTMTSTTDKVPAGTGLFIKGSGDFTITETRDDTTAPATNYLVGVTEDGNVTASTTGTYHYVYAVQDGVATFYNVASDAAITAGKAYLETTTDIKPASGAARVAIIFDEESTGISTMHNSQCIMNNEVYDLQGRRVNTMLGNSEKENVNSGSLKKGLYIVNGKKIIK